MNSLLPTKTRAILTAAVAAVLPLFVPHARGQGTYTYSGANTSQSSPDLWSVGTNWSPSAPVSGSTTTLNFASSFTANNGFYTKNDETGTFLLNTLNFADTSSAAGTAHITGNPLEFISNGTATPVLNLNATGTASNNIPTLSIDAAVVLQNDLTVNANTFNSSSGLSGTFSAGVSGTGALIKNGAGAFTLSGTDTYSGATTLNAGTLTISSAAFSGTGAFNVNGGTLTLSGTDSGTTSVAVNNGTFSITGAGLTSGTTTVSLNSGTLSNGSTTTQTFGGITIAGTGSTLTAGSSSTINLGAISRTAGGVVNITGSATAVTGTINTTTTTNTNGVLGGYATVGGVTWAVAPSTSGGAITPLLLASYSAPAAAGNTATQNVDVTASTTVNSGVTDAFNTIRFNTASPLTLTLATGTTNVVTTGGILQTATTNNNETITGGFLTSGASDLVLSSYLVNTTGLIIASTITDNGTTSVGVTTSGTGTINLTGLNTYTGPTVLSGRNVYYTTIGNVSGTTPNSFGEPANGNGTITIANATNFELNAAVTASSDRPLALATPNVTVTMGVLSGGTLNLSGGITGNNTSLSFTGTGTFSETGSIALGTGSVTNAVAHTVTFGSSSSTLSYSGATTVSSGTLIINGTDNRTGTTTVSGGTLLLNGAPSSGIATAGAVSVTSGTLGGTGTATGALTVTSGTITAGVVGSHTTVVSGAVGMLTLSSVSTATLASGSIYQVDLNSTTADIIKFGGALLSNATLSFVLQSGSTLASTYEIASYASDAGSSFAGDSGTNTATTTYNGGSLPTGYELYDTGTALYLSDVAVSVPEPGTFVLPSLLSGWLLLVLARRRKVQMC